MAELWLSVTDLPAGGRDFLFTDQTIWSGPWAEYRMNCRAVEPLEAALHLLRQDQGCLISGRLHGVVALPCARCAEEALAPLDQRFDEYEEVHEQGEEQGWLRHGDNGLELDAGSLLWEQFLLALPDKPLCRPDCRGLCPSCGGNRNEGGCICHGEEGDQRLAPLKNLKIPSR